MGAIQDGAWEQVYAPWGAPGWLAALVAALPIALLFWLLGVRRTPAHRAALAGVVAAFLVAVLFIGMPPVAAAAALLNGAAYGVLPIGWVVFAAFVFYQVLVDTGRFEALKASVSRLTDDRRIQAILIAFSFSAILEGAAGFGIPVAISASLLAGLGFRPFTAAVLCLLANTAPVAWGSLGIPLTALQEASGLPISDLSAMNARILPLVSAIVPIWLVRTMVGWRETLEVLPAALVSGLTFAVTQFLWGNREARLVDLASGLLSLSALAAFLLVWRPRQVWRFPEERESDRVREQGRVRARPVWQAWVPFGVLIALVVLSGVLRKPVLERLELGPIRASYQVPVPGLHLQVARMPPVVRERQCQKALYPFSPLVESGTAVFAAALIASILARQGRRGFAASFLSAGRRMRGPILTIMPMVALGFLTRYSGIDAILGLALAGTGVLYPFFGTYLGWLGVAITGSDTSSNLLFGSLQRITAEQTGISPVLMCSANSAGGAVGKMVNAGSIVVATAATGQGGSEGKLLAAVFVHSLAMTGLVAAIVTAFAYLVPGLIPGAH